MCGPLDRSAVRGVQVHLSKYLSYPQWLQTLHVPVPVPVVSCDQRPQHTCFGYARRGLRPYGRRGGGPLSRVSNPFLATQPLQANQRTYLGKRPTSRSIHTIHYVQTGREAQMARQVARCKEEVGINVCGV